jgi:hypothetical protein
MPEPRHSLAHINICRKPSAAPGANLSPLRSGGLTQAGMVPEAVRMTAPRPPCDFTAARKVGFIPPSTPVVAWERRQVHDAHAIHLGHARRHSLMLTNGKGELLNRRSAAHSLLKTSELCFGSIPMHGG